MATNLFSKANEEFVSENYKRAVELYSEAIDADDGKDDFYVNRAQAYLKLDQYKEACDDCGKALSINPNNGKAYLRKGISLFHLKDYKNAIDAFREGKQIAAGDDAFQSWIDKSEKELPPLSVPPPQQTGVSAAVPSAPQQTGVSAAVPSAPQQTGVSAAVPSAPQQMGVSAAVPSAPQQTGVSAAVPSAEMTSPSEPAKMTASVKSKHDWYQTATHVIVTVLIKHVQKEDFHADIKENTLGVQIKMSDGEDYSLDINLAHSIVPEQSLYKVMSTKVEIKLKKHEGIQWTKLEGDGQPSAVKPMMAAVPVEAPTQHYPTSSQMPTDWDKLAQEVAAEEKDEKKEGDAALNSLFQQIYSDGSDEVRRAMVKSFYQSGGTVLSTNWSEVGEKEVEIKPPDGMEWKQY